MRALCLNLATLSSGDSVVEGDEVVEEERIVVVEGLEVVVVVVVVVVVDDDDDIFIFLRVVGNLVAFVNDCWLRKTFFVVVDGLFVVVVGAASIASASF